MIKNSFLPARYEDKLNYDLQQILTANVEGLETIILFGSCARNEFRVGSDLDILVLTKESVSKTVRGELASDLEEKKNGISTDLIFYTTDEFEQSMCFLVKEIKKDGLILWEREYA